MQDTCFLPRAWVTEQEKEAGIRLCAEEVFLKRTKVQADADWLEAKRRLEEKSVQILTDDTIRPVAQQVYEERRKKEDSDLFRAASIQLMRETRKKDMHEISVETIETIAEGLREKDRQHRATHDWWDGKSMAENGTFVRLPMNIAYQVMARQMRATPHP